MNLNKKDSLAIIAGKGDLPKMIAKKCQDTKRPFAIFLIKDEAKEEDFSQYSYNIVPIGYIGQLLKLMKKENVRDMVFAGGVSKPSMANLKADGKGAFLISKILAAKLFGDDNLLSTITNFFKKEGFNIVGAHEIIADLTTQKGFLGKIEPDKSSLKDIEIGANALKIMSELDIGQAIAVQQKNIIGVEAIEGTDALLDRCEEIQLKTGKKPVLIKMKKANQNTKIDLPSLGVNTIENLHRANFAGVALEAGSSIIINQKEVIKLADAYGLFVIGV